MMMMNCLEDFNDQLRKLQQEGVNRQDKEALEILRMQVRNITDMLDDERRRMFAMMQILEENRTFSRAADPLQGMLSSKQREIDAWEDILSTINRLM